MAESCLELHPVIHIEAVDYRPMTDGIDPVTLSAAYADKLTGWALLLIAGSVGLVLGTSYHHPRRRMFRYTYFLFVPAWGFLATSAYYGARAQQAALGYAWSSTRSIPIGISTVRDTMAGDIWHQQTLLHYGLATMVLWLLLYLLWWVLSSEEDNAKTP